MPTKVMYFCLDLFLILSIAVILGGWLGILAMLVIALYKLASM